MKVGFVLVLLGCNDPKPPAGATLTLENTPKINAALVAKGEKIYKENCASCHGARGEGAKNWDVPGTNGKQLPPPLDGSGQTWHHASPVLREIILNGSVAGKGNMPSFKEKLSEDDVDALIGWIQSLWPADIYNAWLDVEGRIGP